MNEFEYWSNKSSMDRVNSDLEHQEIMNNLILENEYKLFSMLKPSFGIDGDYWYVLYGKDLQDGISGFGKSLYLAILDFNKQFTNKIKEQRP